MFPSVRIRLLQFCSVCRRSTQKLSLSDYMEQSDNGALATRALVHFGARLCMNESIQWKRQVRFQINRYSHIRNSGEERTMAAKTAKSRID